MGYVFKKREYKPRKEDVEKLVRIYDRADQYGKIGLLNKGLTVNTIVPYLQSSVCHMHFCIQQSLEMLPENRRVKILTASNLILGELAVAVHNSMDITDEYGLTPCEFLLALNKAFDVIVTELLETSLSEFATYNILLHALFEVVSKHIPTLFDKFNDIMEGGIEE